MIPGCKVFFSGRDLRILVSAYMFLRRSWRLDWLHYHRRDRSSRNVVRIIECISSPAFRAEIMTSPTTPRDAIGLSDRLRFDAARCEIHFSKGVASNIEEAATALDALQARVKELEAADRYANLISVIADIREKSGVGGKPMLSELADAIGSKLADAESRATSAEQERDKALACCDSYANESQQLHDRMEKAQQERDEAYERAAKVAEQKIERYVEGMSGIDVRASFQLGYRWQDGPDIAAAIRRLAAGTEKEGK